MTLQTPAPTQYFSYLASINALLNRPASGLEIAEAAFRVNTDLRSYFSRAPIDRTPLLQLPAGIRSSIRSSAENYETWLQPADPAQALYLATCVAIMRGDADRLRPVQKPVIRTPRAHMATATL